MENYRFSDKWFEKFYEKDKEQGEIRSNLLLHNRHLQRKDYLHRFNMYDKISDNSNVYLKNLFNHVLDEFSDLELLKGNNKRIIIKINIM